MPEPFNAYHQWLSLPADETNPTYYQILGLAEFESDAAKITQAGDRAITRVRGFRPGQHAKEWSRLLDEINAAKSCLLDTAVKAEYDRCLRSGRDGKADQPASRKTSLPIAKSTERAPVDLNRFPPGMAPPGAVIASAVPTASPAVAAAIEPVVTPVAVDAILPPAAVDHLLPVGAVPMAQPVWQQPTVGGGYAPQAVPLGYAAPVGYASPMIPGVPATDPMAPLIAPVAPVYPATPYASQGYAAPAYAAPVAAPTMQPPYAAPTGYGHPAAAPASTFPEAKPAANGASVATVLARRRQQAQRNTLIVAGGGCLLLTAGIVGYANREKLVELTKTQVADASHEPTSIDTSGESDTSGDSAQPLPRTIEGTIPKQRDAQPEPMPPMPMPMPEVKPETAPPPTPEPTPETKSEPNPAPEPAPPPMPVPMPTKAELAALGKALTAGKEALTKYDFAAADEQIAAAQTLAKLPEHQDLTSRLKEVAGYVKQFKNAVNEGLKALQPQQEIKVGTSTMVIVVAVSPEKLTIRRAGGNVTYPVDELPAGLMMAIADSWFKQDDPVNRVIKGAYFAVAEGDVDSHREKAKKYWDEAIAVGIDVKPLLPFLTDKYDLDKQADAKPSP